MQEPGTPSQSEPSQQSLIQALAELETAARNAKPAEREAIMERLIHRVETFFREHRATEHTEWASALRNIVKEHPRLLIRRENPETLFAALERKESLTVKFDPTAHSGEPYPNAAALGENLEGLRIPFTRGFGAIKEGIGIFMVGFESGASVTARHLPPAVYPHYSGHDRVWVRMVDGSITPAQVKCVLFRIPRLYFPEDLMTEEEQESQAPHITRLYRFAEKAEKKTDQ